MKSNPTLLKQNKYSRPRFTDRIRNFEDGTGQNEEDPGDSYYYKFCDNQSSTRPFDRRRRKLPTLAESDISINLEGVTSYNSLAGAIPLEKDESLGGSASDYLSCVEDPELIFGGFRRGAFDRGGGRSMSSTTTPSTSAEGPDGHQGRRGALAGEIGSLSSDSSAPAQKESKNKHTPIIYCRYSNMPNQTEIPAVHIEMCSKGDS